MHVVQIVTRERVHVAQVYTRSEFGVLSNPGTRMIA